MSVIRVLIKQIFKVAEKALPSPAPLTVQYKG
jgi:hypothetical protein